MTGQLRQVSMINAASSDPVIDEFSMSGDDYTQLAMEMPSMVRRKKKKGKKVAKKVVKKVAKKATNKVARKATRKAAPKKTARR